VVRAMRTAAPEIQRYAPFRFIHPTQPKSRVMSDMIEADEMMDEAMEDEQ